MSAASGSATGGPLAGVRVIDLTSVFFGPYATLLMSDMGAEVIKVEPPSGDVVRTIGPARNRGMSAIFLNANRGKRGVVIDLTRPRGRELLLRLTRDADVFVHSMRPAAVAKLGLSYEEIAAECPEILYCNGAGFGRDGRYTGRPAYDDVIQGASGLAAAQERLTGEPQYIAGAIADKTAGLALATALLAGLYHRERTGRGQEIEVPMFETVASFFLLEHLYGAVFEPWVGEPIYPRVSSPMRRPYRTADGYLCVVVYNDKQWSRFFEAVGRAGLMDDPRFNSIGARTEHIEDLYEILAAELTTRTTEEWLATLEQLEIPAQRLADVAALLADPHLEDVGFFRLVDHPSEGRIRSMESPYSFFGSPVEIGRFAPRLGEHTAAVLAESGLGRSEIDQLVSDGIVGVESGGR